jgi:hypothetical protein
MIQTLQVEGPSSGALRSEQFTRKEKPERFSPVDDHLPSHFCNNLVQGFAQTGRMPGRAFRHDRSGAHGVHPYAVLARIQRRAARQLEDGT